MNSRWILLVFCWISFNANASPLDLRLGLASNSAVKRIAAESAFHKLFPDKNIILTTYAAPSQIAEQPVGERSGILGAQNRLSTALQMGKDSVKNDYWISIENYIEKPLDPSQPWVDRAVVLIQKEGSSVLEFSRTVPFDSQFAILAQSKTPPDYPFASTGYSTTVGRYIEDKYGAHVLSHNDWHGHPAFGGSSRVTLMEEAIARGVIKNEIDTIMDFPKKGVVFQDISPLLANPDVFQATINLLALQFENLEIDAVAGLEARGFILGAPLALKLKKPFIPIRKKGKLPRPTHHQRYQKEYGEDEIEITADGISGKTVLLVDDLLATGGTLKAAEELFKSAGAKQTLSVCLIELLGMGGRAELQSPFSALLQYSASFLNSKPLGE